MARRAVLKASTFLVALVSCSKNDANIGSNRPESPSGNVIASQQRSSPQDAEVVVTAYLDAMQNENWATCADLMHHDALAGIVDVAKALLQNDKTKKGARTIFGVGTESELAAIPPPQLFSNMSTWRTHNVPGSDDMFRNMKSTVLGSVAEGDNLHVVYRYSTKLRGVSVSKVQVLSVKRDERGWRLLLPADVADVVNAVIIKVNEGH